MSKIHRSFLANVPLIPLLMACALACFGQPSTSKPGKSKGPPPTYFSAQKPGLPPLPFNPFPALPVVEMSRGKFIYDDLDFDYSPPKHQSAGEISAKDGVADDAPGGMNRLTAEDGLILLVPEFSGNQLTLKIAGNDPERAYDLYSSTNVAATNGWRYVGRLLPGRTNITITATGQEMEFFRLADTTDTDGDSLPDAFEALVAGLDPTVPNALATIAADNPAYQYLTDVAAEVRVKKFSGTNQVQRVRDDFYQDFLVRAEWTRGEGGQDERYSYVGFGAGALTLLGQVTWNGAGAVTSGTNAAYGAMPTTSWAHVLESSYVPVDATNWTRSTNFMDTRIELATGGKGLSEEKNLFVLGVAVSEVQRRDDPPGYVTIGPVPNSSITVLGEHPDGDGKIWKMIADNRAEDVTPVVSSPYTNYSFVVVPQKVKLQIFRGSADIAGTFQTVWVGEPINLQCQLNPSVGTLSNIQWTIPGTSFSNYVAGASLGKVFRDYSRTNATVGFIWIEGTSRTEVQCSAMVNGFTVTSKVIFDVKRPTATITAVFQKSVAVDGDWDVSPALHLGSPGTPGIHFSYSPQGGQGAYQWVQLGSVTTRYKNGTDNAWYRAHGSGLDTYYPYPKLRVNNIVTADAGDSPGIGLVNGVLEYSRDDSFEMHLMFNPSPAIGTSWVPLRKISWSWSGRAILSNGAFYLSQPAQNFGVDSNSTNHPEWTSNIDPAFKVFSPE